MLNWCIVTLAGARLKASIRFPPIRGMYQGDTCKGHDNCYEVFYRSAYRSYFTSMFGIIFSHA